MKNESKEFPGEFIGRKSLPETGLWEERQKAARNAIFGDVQRAAAVAYDLNPDINYKREENPDKRIRGVSKEDLAKTEDALLRLRVMVDPWAQELFPDIKAEIPQDREQWLKTVQELSSYIPPLLPQKNNLIPQTNK